MKRLIGPFVLLTFLLTACQPAANQTSGRPRVLAAESFLADIAQNVAGDRLTVERLVPLGVDPHEYQPTPKDTAKIAESQVLIVNGIGYEWWLQKTLDTIGGERLVVVTSAGLTANADTTGQHPDGDPHMWLDPNNVVRYVENIRDGLSKADPQGKSIYAANADSYIKQLKILDEWITQQVGTVSPSQRLLVTNHESLGYFADRYGFTIVGAVIPSLSTDASPTAQQMTNLIQTIKSSGANTILLDVGANPDLAQQIATETGARVVTDLYLETLSAPDGSAPSYIMMMRHNVDLIVAACAT
jgi:ABC-type Zn uptake system ZnuABC Zn-binding protein ZnuA